MTKVTVKVHLPQAFGNGKVFYFANNVIFADEDGNIYNIPDTLIDRLHAFLEHKRVNVKNGVHSDDLEYAKYKLKLNKINKEGE